MRKLLGGVAVLVTLSFAISAAMSPLASAQTKPKEAVIQKDKSKTTKTETKGGNLVIEIYKDNADEFRFRIKDGDHLLASSGKGYEKKDDIQKVIDNLKSNLGKAKTEDHPDKGKGK